MIDFSLILPSRERVSLLKGFLESVRATTDHPENLEVLVAIDRDDRPTMDARTELQVNSPFFVHFRVFDRQDNLHAGYYNPLAYASDGRYIFVLNDDCELITPHWDALALEVLLKAPWKEFYGKTQDALGDKYAMFPIVSREAVEVQGWVINPDIPAAGGDDNLFCIWSELERVIDLPMITVKHVAYYHGNRQRDKVSEHVAEISVKTNSPEMVKPHVGRIRAILEQRRGS